MKNIQYTLMSIAFTLFIGNSTVLAQDSNGKVQSDINGKKEQIKAQGGEVKKETEVKTKEVVEKKEVQKEKWEAKKATGTDMDLSKADKELREGYEKRLSMAKTDEEREKIKAAMKKELAEAKTRPMQANNEVKKEIKEINKEVKKEAKENNKNSSLKGKELVISRKSDAESKVVQTGAHLEKRHHQLNDAQRKLDAAKLRLAEAKEKKSIHPAEIAAKEATIARVEAKISQFKATLNSASEMHSVQIQTLNGLLNEN